MDPGCEVLGKYLFVLLREDAFSIETKQGLVKFDMREELVQ